MTSTRDPALADELAAVGRRGGCLDAVADAVCAAVHRVVPYGFGCLATTDPSSGLISWAHKTEPLPIGDEEFAAAEYGGPDVNQFADLAARAEPVGVLSIDTDGRQATCRRFREFLAPRFGFSDELRVVFRAQGLTWGALALYRRAGQPDFTAADARAVVAVHGQVADLLRQALFASDPARSTTPTGPAVLIVDAGDRIVNLTAAAEARIEELGGWDHGSLPTALLIATAAARNTAGPATTRAIGRSGRWLIVQAATFARGPGDVRTADDVVVTVETASPADISTLALSARGLSPREQEVAGLVLQGASTRAIADTLFLSPHTVQDHLKSIFAKLGVNSRRELVRGLVLT